MNVNRSASWMIIVALVLLLLIIGQSILIPFVFALLIWFVVKKTRNLIDKVGFIRQYIPSWIKSILASFLIFGLLLMAARVLMESIESLSMSYKDYISNVEIISSKINEYFKVDIQEEVSNFVLNFDFSAYLKSLFNSLSEIVGHMVMIVFYVVFLFIEETLFQRKFKMIFTKEERYHDYTNIIQKVDKAMSSYISLKSIIALLTTSLSYVILLFVGIDSPLFWAFLIFMLNFIPSVGPIIGTILPALFSLLQFGEFVPFLIILLGIGSVATLVGSLVEPRLMGNTLNISPLVAILSLAIWGAIWGITGMLLSVPITVALIIIFAQFESTRSLAILLSEKGRVRNLR